MFDKIKVIINIVLVAMATQRGVTTRRRNDTRTKSR